MQIIEITNDQKELKKLEQQRSKDLHGLHHNNNNHHHHHFHKQKIPIRRITKPNRLAAISTWSCQEVSRWVCKTCLEYGLPLPFPTDKFLMNGKALLLLGKSDFASRSVTCGDIMYKELSKIKKEQRQQQQAQTTNLNKKGEEKMTIKKPSINKNNFDMSEYSSIYDVKQIIADTDKMSNMDDSFYDYLHDLNKMTLGGILCFQKQLVGGSCGAKCPSTNLASNNKRCIMETGGGRPHKLKCCKPSLYQFTDLSALNKVF